MRYNPKGIPTAVLRLMPEEERRRLGAAGALPEEGLARAEVKLEKDLQARLGDLLRLRDIAFFRQRMDRKTTGTVGWPDITFAIGGQAIAWECKVGANGLGPDQVKMIAAMEKNGWTVRVIRSVEEGFAHLGELCQKPTHSDPT